jgi:hypothetical protein
VKRFPPLQYASAVYSTQPLASISDEQPQNKPDALSLSVMDLPVFHADGIVPVFVSTQQSQND